ncbi:MAG: hypothetical protein C0623_13165 [Desulfuromonas sp.]|nr:MAG: hypothetical protein C0623_13165 [Desulfuromonas sp.]
MDNNPNSAQPDLAKVGSPPLPDSFLRSAVPNWLLISATILLAIGLYSLSRYNFLLFHLLVETFFIVVAFTVFSIGWNSRRFSNHNALIFLSAAFAVIGSIELLHSVSFRGINIFPEISANPATQLWIAARYLEVAAFLASALLLGRKKMISPWHLLAIPVFTGILVCASIWPLGLFPDCYIEGSGLTRFKIVSELIIAALFGLSILLFWKNRDHLDRRVLKLLIAALSFSIVAELTFTLYQDIYGMTNFLGHFSKLMSVILIYRVLVIGTLRSPYAVLFRDLSQANTALDLELIQRKKTERALRAANRELDAFVRTVSHDLSTPLTPIVGLPDLLLERHRGSLDESSIRALCDIRDQGMRMARILEDLVLFARAGRHLDNVAVAPLDTVLQNVLEDLGSRIIESGCRVEVGTMPDVSYPRTALFQIFSNLAGNAVKYACAAGNPIEISGEIIENDVVLKVRDHGPGIAKDLREKIFDVFYRGAETREEPGSGIGLATVRKIARHLGGDAGVEETPGGGATFIVRLALPEAERQQELDFDTF